MKGTVYCARCGRDHTVDVVVRAISQRFNYLHYLIEDDGDNDNIMTIKKEYEILSWVLHEAGYPHDELKKNGTEEFSKW